MFHPESLRQQSNESRREADVRALEIAGMGKYDLILEALRREKLLEAEVARVEHVYALGEISFLNDRDREMFTVLDLYDTGTAHHCLETYKIAKEEMEIKVDGDTSFAELLREREGVSLEQFYRACLLHDIGKVGVPRSVIQHNMGDGVMLGCMHRVYHELYAAGKIPVDFGLSDNSTDLDIDQALNEHHARAIYFVPAHEAFVDDPAALAEVRSFGFTGDETLMDMIKTHEAGSGAILAAAGLPVESYLAGHHHNYDNEPLRYPLTTDTLHISIDLADMLHIADVMQALSAKRFYKGAFRLPKIMRIVVEHVQDKKIKAMSAYIVLTNQLQKYDAATHNIGDGSAHDEDEANLRIVRDFLAQVAERVDMKAA